MRVLQVLILLVACLGSTSAVSYAQNECPDAPAIPQDRRQVLNQLTVATFNTEWLFDGINDASSPWQGEAAAVEHLARVAEVIQRIDADIVNLVEVEDCTILKELNALLPDMGYHPYLLQGTDSSTRQDVAILTRVDPVVNLQRTAERVDYPIPGSGCGFTGSDDSGVSKHYWTRFDVNGIEIVLIGLHFVAFPTMEARCAQREAQASVIQKLVKDIALHEEYEVIVLGDFNDYDEQLPDLAGNLPTSIVLKTLRDPHEEQEGEELFNVAALLEPQNRYSSWWDQNDNGQYDGEQEQSLIDHVLVSRGLLDRVQSISIDHTHDPSVVSDHWPIVVQFNLQGDENSSTEPVSSSTPIATSSPSNANSVEGEPQWLIILSAATALIVVAIIALVTLMKK